MHNPPHPGESLLHDVLPAVNMSIRALASHLSYSHAQLAKICRGSASINAELAYRLELAGAGNARMWLEQQSAYSLWHARQRAHPPIKRLAVASA